MNFNTEEILNQILSKNRFVGVVPYSEDLARFIILHNLDSLDLPTQETSLPHSIVAPQKKISEILTEEKILEIGFPEYEKSALKLFKNIRDLSICKAFLKMQYSFIAKNYMSPEIDIIYGLLFGFKICDIRYYVQTRDQNFPKHRFETILDEKIGVKERTLKEQGVLCEKCTEEYLQSLSQ